MNRDIYDFLKTNVNECNIFKEINMYKARNKTEKQWKCPKNNDYSIVEYGQAVGRIYPKKEYNQLFKTHIQILANKCSQKGYFGYYHFEDENECCYFNIATKPVLWTKNGIRI